VHPRGRLAQAGVRQVVFSDGYMIEEALEEANRKYPPDDSAGNPMPMAAVGDGKSRISYVYVPNLQESDPRRYLWHLVL